MPSFKLIHLHTLTLPLTSKNVKKKITYLQQITATTMMTMDRTPHTTAMMMMVIMLIPATK
jgi:hypothetical protein